MHLTESDLRWWPANLLSVIFSLPIPPLHSTCTSNQSEVLIQNNKPKWSRKIFFHSIHVHFTQQKNNLTQSGFHTNRLFVDDLNFFLLSLLEFCVFAIALKSTILHWFFCSRTNIVAFFLNILPIISLTKNLHSIYVRFT